MRGARTGLRQDTLRREQGTCGRYGFLLLPGWESCGALGAPRQTQRPSARAHSQQLTPPRRSPAAAGAGVGYVPPGLCWQRDTELIPAPSNIRVSLKRRHLLTLLPPAGTVPPRKGPKGERFVHVTTSQADRTHAHTHTHTIECNRTQCKNQFHAHAIRLCKAHTLQYSRRRGGRGGRRWLRYCTGVNVNNKASSKRALQETKRTVALYKNALKTTRFS